MAYADGDDFILGALLSYQQANRMKDHWRQAAFPATPQGGMLHSRSTNDKLHHYGAAWEEVLQLTRSNDVSPQFASVRHMDTNSSHYLDIVWNEDDVAHRILNLLVESANKSLTIRADTILDGGPYKENMLTNSPFGVWSQSDTNKGLATLPYDTGSSGGGDAPDVGDTVTGATSGATGVIISYTIAAGAFATNNASGVLTLGAVTGCFQDNETINFTDGETALVNGDKTTGVVNDPCNNDDTADWTDDGANIALAFAVAEYTVTTNAATQRAWIASLSFTAGKIYKIEIDIKDGTQAGADIETYFDDGAAQYGKIETTAAGWASIYYTFEAASTTAAGKAGFRIPTSLGGNNIEIRRFSCYEITPCCTVADALAFDGWVKDTTLDIYREHAGANTFNGMFYALKMVPSTANDFVYWPKSIYNKEEWYRQFRGITVSFAIKANTNTANHLRIAIEDSAGTAYSSYHTGGGADEWLEITRTINAAATSVRFLIYNDQAGAVDGSTICYVGLDIAAIGASIGEGNYRPRQQEIIPLDLYMNSNKLHGTTGHSTTGNTTLNVEADTDGRLPKGSKQVFLQFSANDAGSAGGACYLRCRSEWPNLAQAYASPYGLANDCMSFSCSWQKCGVNGDFDYEILATGAGTFDINYFRYFSVQVN